MRAPFRKLSKNEVNRAGEILVCGSSSEAELQAALSILSSWRGRHSYPINTFQATLRKRLGGIDSSALVAQRLKRSPSIIAKLRRLDGMKLSRMQDIGGLRAVVDRLHHVNELRSLYEDVGRLEHELESVYDYIELPKTDGYRSIHLVFRYKNPNAIEYDGLLLELQLRTKLQHAWATAVETMGTFVGQSLKSRQGDSHWLRFFELTSSAFAHLEKSPLVPGWSNLDFESTCMAVRDAELQLGVLEKLEGFSVVANAITSNVKGSSKYHLVILDSFAKTVEIHPYAKHEFEKALDEYERAERRAIVGEKIEVFLVSAGPVESLRRAYPNFFLDTDVFIRRVRRIIEIGTDARKRRPRAKLLIRKGQGYFDF